MRVFVPFTEVRRRTRQALELYNPSFVDCGASQWAYPEFFQARWAEGETFINVEHDVVPWPGAIEQLWDCPHDWCWFSYPGWTADEAPFGCVKFSAALIAEHPGVWDQYPGLLKAQGGPCFTAWCGLDVYWWWYALRRGVSGHQHFSHVGSGC